MAPLPNNQADEGFRYNQLLSALETESRESIEPYLEPVEFELGAVACDAGDISNMHIFRAAQFYRC